MAGGKCLGDSWGRSRRKLSHSQQSSNMTDPKPPGWRKWGRKECLMRCVVTTEEGASPPRPQPATQRAPSSHSALTGGRGSGGPGCHGPPGPRAAKCRLRSAGVQSSGLWKNTELKGCLQERKQEAFYRTLCISLVKSSILEAY